METKANYVRVGIFTIVALALAFGFVYWSIFSRQDQSDVTLLVRIEGSVTGLQQGSQVLFNGLPVGSVKALRLDSNNPEVVIATTEVDPDLKVIFITGFAAVALNADSQAPKDAKVLSKPFHLRDLVLEVDRMFQGESKSGLI